ncbi:MAG: hypothetical protein AABY22_32445 [Nanoarchaeota archaeon]|mgnify:CR=1 FL=1
MNKFDYLWFLIPLGIIVLIVIPFIYLSYHPEEFSNESPILYPDENPCQNSGSGHPLDNCW